MDGTSISTISPARAFINKGVNIGANIVEKAVMVTDIATFALATNAMTFDAKPLGDEPTKTKPAAIPTGNEKAWAKAKPVPSIVQPETVNQQQAVVQPAQQEAAVPQQTSQHPGWLWNAEQNQWVPDPDYVNNNQ